MPIFLSFLLSLNVFAGEPDNFSARLDKSAKVANADINRVVNSVLSLAVQDFDPAGKLGCNKEKFMKLLEDDLDRNFPAIYKYMHLNLPFAGPKTFNEVPYKDMRAYTRSFFAASTKVQSKDGKTFFIGLDKLDHFFAHGQLYWKLIGKDPKLPKAKLEAALQLGIEQEQGPWGLKSSAIKSYGDLSANYHGLYFWRDLLDGSPALIVCQQGKFVMGAEFDIAKYIDASMDESINCNSYATEEILHKVTKITEARGQRCPVEPATCEALKKKFPEQVAEKILHPRCLGKKHSQVEAASAVTSKDIIDGAQALVDGGENLFWTLFGNNKNAVQGAPEAVTVPKKGTR